LIVQSVFKATPQSLLCFVGNHATNVGGGMSTIASTLILQGYVVFLKNRAAFWGGGLGLDSSMCLIEGRISFTGWPVDVHFCCYVEVDE
jgi:hypothetical protein